MALTRAQVETILIRRTGALLTEANLDGTTVDGTNADLNDPVGYSIRQCGGTVADITAVADSDLSGIGVDDYDKLLDVAEVRTLETVFDHLTSVSISAGQYSESHSQLPERLARMIEVKRKQIEAKYGIGRRSLEAGVITLDFAEHND